MEPEEELNLLKDYMEYFIDLRYYKAIHSLKLREWDGHGPTPRLDVRSVKYLKPLSFEDWIKYIKYNSQVSD